MLSRSRWANPRAVPTAGWGGFALLLGGRRRLRRRRLRRPRLGASLPPLQGVGAGLIATSLTLALVMLARGDASVAVLAAMPARDLAILGYTGLVATGGAYLAFVLGMHLSRSPTVGIAPTLIEPGVAAVLAALVLQERLSRARVGRLRAHARRDAAARRSPNWHGLARRLRRQPRSRRTAGRRRPSPRAS